MQPELPWNVAGIPPEAREAARAAARREGLSVGEWLTRRILRSLTDASEGVRESWRTATSYRGLVEESSSSQDSADMLARVARSETEAQASYQRIEEQLKSVSRRLDQNERSQSENNRALSKAATEINIATREQAQAFDQLGAHVVSLNERLGRLEQHVASESSRDAVKALHQGLSRLADQIAETAKHSAAQTEQLASNIETIAGKLSESRNDAEQSWHALDERVAALAANVGSLAGKLLESRDDAEHASRAIDERISAIADRVRVVEQAAQSSAAAIGKALESIELAQAGHQKDEAETQRQAAALSQLSEQLHAVSERLTTNEARQSGAIAHLDSQLTESLDGLTERLAASEARQSGALARLEEQAARLEARGTDPGIERRLQGIEHALGDIAERLEKAEHADRSAAFEDGLRNLVLRMDDSDRRNRDAIAELRTAIKSLTPAETAAPVAAAVAAPAAAVASFDLPPFAETHAAPPPPAEVPPPPPVESPPPPPVVAPEHPPVEEHVTEAVAAGTALGAEPLAPPTEQSAESAAPESFLAAARRTARAASTAEADTSRGSLFSWVSRDGEGEGSSTRIALIAGILLLIVAAVAASIFLSRGASPTPPPPAQPAATAAPSSAAPQASQTPASQSVPQGTANQAENAPSASTAQTTRPGGAGTSGTPPSSPAPQTPASLHDRLSGLAESGNSKAEELLGLQYLDGDGVPVNEAEAAKWLERAANQGEAVAAYRLGTLYERGHGVPADPTRAVQWYALAAKEGNRKAMHNLAVAYAQGSGIEKNLTTAAQWFSRAAALGLADSEFNLAVLYERGMGVPQNLTDAYKWYAIAAAQGDTESKARIDALGTQLSADDKAAAEKAATDFRPQPLNRSANTPPDATTLVRG